MLTVTREDGKGSHKYRHRSCALYTYIGLVVGGYPVFSCASEASNHTMPCNALRYQFDVLACISAAEISLIDLIHE